MILSEEIKKIGKPHILTGCSRRMLPGFFKEMGYKIGAEVGVYKGEFSEQFCQAGLKTYSIDCWKSYVGAGRVSRSQVSQDEIYEEAKVRLSFYKGLSIIVKKMSAEAINDFKDGSLDFVYIDGNHEFPHAAFDLYYWSRKVRKGGIISGHDYINSSPHATGTLCHVRTAVDAYVELFEIPNWWVIAHIGRRNRTSEDDRYPSWMWFKP